MSEPTPGELAVYAVLAKTGITGAIVPYATAIDGAFVLIPRDELPEVRPCPSDRNAYRTDGQSIVYMSAQNARDWVIRDVAVWQFMEAAEAQQKTAEREVAAKLDKRRDELAVEFGCSPLGYKDTFDSTQRAIDRIIELEAARDRP